MLAHIDALKQQLQNSPSIQAEIETWHELAWTHFLRDEAEDLAAALAQAERLLQDEQIAASHHAHHAILVGFYRAIAVTYVDALEQALVTEQKWYKVFVGAWKWRMPYLLATIHSRIGNFDEGMAAYRQTLEIAKANNDGMGEHLGLSGVGFIYGYLKDYDNALNYFLQSLVVANRIAHQGLQFTAHFNLCQIYIYTKELDKAEIAAQETLTIAQSTNDDRYLALATTRIVHVHLALEQYEQAEYLLKVRLGNLSDNSSMRYPRLNLLYLLARVYKTQHQYSQTIQLLSDTIASAKAMGNNPIVLECFEDLITAHEQVGNYQEALQCQKEYFNLYRKFHDERNVEKIQMLEILHRTREAETQLAHQKLISEEAINRAEQTKQYFQELNNIKSEFIDSATHDLKNPLTGIRLNTDLLRRKINPNYHRYLDRIESDTERMNRLIADMLDVAKLETGNALNLSFNSMERLIDEVLSTYIAAANTKGINIITQYPDIAVSFYFDASYLYRALSNLFSNAIKYSSMGTQITIRLSCLDTWVSIAVEDQGVGIPEQDLPHIFERFYRVEHETTAKIEGTGLGLAIVKAIVEQHNGTINVASQLGEGTTFTILLPYIQDLAHMSRS